MKITKKVSIETEIVEDVICNLCGKSLEHLDGFNFCGIEEIVMNCPYGSHNDGTTFTFSLCEKCVEEMMSKFKIPAEKVCSWDGECIITL